MNLIHFMLNLCCRPEDDQASLEKKEKEYKKLEEEYKKLIEDLVTRYTNDMNTFEDNDVAMKEKLERLERLVSEMKDNMKEILYKFKS